MDRMRHLISGALALAALSSFGAEARAQFGQKGQLAFDATLRGGFFWEKTTLDAGPDAEASITRFTLAPSMLWFVADNVALGGGLLFEHVDSELDPGPDNTFTLFGFGPTGAYNLRFSALASLLPQLQLTYLHIEGPDDASGYSLGLRLAAPLLVHVAPHLFFGVGPELNRSLIGKRDGIDASGTSFAFSFLIGGWI